VGPQGPEEAKVSPSEWDAQFIASRNWLPDVVERFQAGLLPRDELLALVEAVAFEPGLNQERFCRLTPDCISHHPDVGPHRACFSSRGMSEVTATQWAALKAISELFPDAVVKPKRHVARCPFCGAQDVAYGAVVVLRYGPYEFRREYELPRE
jgi:hypothetical protein